MHELTAADAPTILKLAQLDAALAPTAEEADTIVRAAYELVATLEAGHAAHGPKTDRYCDCDWQDEYVFCAEDACGHDLNPAER